MANLLAAEVATMPSPPLSKPVPMDLDAQEEKRNQRDLDYLLDNPKKFEEVAAIRRDIATLAGQLPTRVSTTEAIRAVGELGMTHQSLKTLADPAKLDVTRGIKVATTLVKKMFDDHFDDSISDSQLVCTTNTPTQEENHESPDQSP